MGRLNLLDNPTTPNDFGPLEYKIWTICISSNIIQKMYFVEYYSKRCISSNMYFVEYVFLEYVLSQISSLNTDLDMELGLN